MEYPVCQLVTWPFKMSTQESPNSPEEEVLEKVRKFLCVASSTAVSKFHQNYLDIANERKQDGNDCFRAGKWNEALTAYRSALNSLPKRPTKSRPDTSELDETLGEDSSTKHERKDSDDDEGEPVVDVSSPAVTESEKESVRLRSVLNANIGACFVKLVSAVADQQKYSNFILQGPKGDHKEAVQACTQGSYVDDTFGTVYLHWFHSHSGRSDVYQGPGETCSL